MFSLLEAKHEVIIADNLCNSKREIVEKIELITGKEVKFYEIDVTVTEDVEKIFEEHKLDGVIHFAGLKAVGESVEKPLEYYYNNIVSTMVLAKACIKHKVNRFVFSSSATVYGENNVPFIESMELLPATNPYGETKAISERILIDVAKANRDFAVSILRYFNPVGAHESGLIGEVPNGIPNNLMPYITQVAKGKLEKLRVFGDDYPTPDGTGIRDFIHVVDLAEGHVVSLEKLTPGVHIYNLGTGKGTSVLELVKAFEKQTELKFLMKLWTVVREISLYPSPMFPKLNESWAGKQNEIFLICVEMHGDSRKIIKNDIKNDIKDFEFCFSLKQ